MLYNWYDYEHNVSRDRRLHKPRIYAVYGEEPESDSNILWRFQ